MLTDEIKENREKLKRLDAEFNNAEPDWVEPIIYEMLMVESVYDNLLKELKKKNS